VIKKETQQQFDQVQLAAALKEIQKQLAALTRKVQQLREDCNNITKVLIQEILISPQIGRSSVY
jgi:molecular chaperone GrpE (heat shock protein)